MSRNCFSFLIFLLLCGFRLAAQMPVQPRITNQTIFVTVKEYAEVDPKISDGVIKISNSGTLSYVDLNGKYLFGENAKLRPGGAGFDYSRGQFSGGTAMVMRDASPNSIIFVDQKYLDLPTTYQKVSGFCEGIAMAEKPSGTSKACCYINSFGQEVFPSLSFSYTYFSENFAVSPLREGMRAFLDPNSKLWGFADANGKIVIKAQFSKVLPFSEGLAAVAITENWSEKWGFVDKQGQMKIPATFKKFPSSFSNGFAVVQTESGKMAYIDPTGKIVSPEFYQCNVFCDGYAFVNTEYCKTAVIDKNFNIVKTLGDNESFEIRGDNATSILEMPLFSSMLAVKPCNGAGIIFNAKGDILFQGADYSARFNNFYNGTLALTTLRIGKTNYSGFMNQKGEMQIVFIPEGTTLSPPDVPQTITAKLDVPQAPTAGKGTLSKSGNQGGSDAVAPVTKEYQLTLAVQPAEAGTATTAGAYLEGTKIMLSAKGTFPNKYKYSFEHWTDETGKVVSTQASFYFTMLSANTKLTAVFKEHSQHRLTLENANPEYGSTSGGGNFFTKEPFTIKAQAGEQRKFDGWYNGTSRYSTQATHSQPMPDADLHLVAKFLEKAPGMDYEPAVFLYTNVSPNDPKTGDFSIPQLEGGGMYKTGTKVTISAPAEFGGKVFEGWYKLTNRAEAAPVLTLKDKKRTFELTMPETSIAFYAYYVDKSGNAPVSGNTGTAGSSGTGGTTGTGVQPDTKPNSQGPLAPNRITDKTCKTYRFAGDYEFTLSAQSLAGIALSAAPVKIPATAYMEIHSCSDLSTLYTGDVMGAIFFDVDPIKIPNDFKTSTKFMEYAETLGGYVPAYFSPLYIYRITDQHIYAMGEGFAGADRKLSNFRSIGRIYRFEYSTTVENAIVLGKYQVYRHSVIRIEGLPMNKYEWVNPGLAESADRDYTAEPEKENRYKNCTFFPTDNAINIPWIAKPDVLKIFDASLKHPKSVDVGVDTWYDFMMMLNVEYEKLYKDLQKYEQPNTTTNTPLPTF